MTAESRVVKTLCQLCGNCCGLDVHVRDGRIVKVEAMSEHPFNTLCIKTRGIIDWVYSKDRITNPRRKVNGKWAEISWDEALEFTADKLNNIKDKYGAKSMVVHVGFPFLGSPIMRLASRFCSAYGTPNFTTGASLCFQARAMAHGLTLNHNAIAISSSYRGSQCLIVWGVNPPQSSVLQAAAVSRARREGAKLIVIDPRVTSLAKEADIYAQIRPGTDCALALGLLNVIISDGLYDKTFVEQWTVGFDQLEKHLRQYSPEKVEQITWVPVGTIRSIARMYAANKPACISQGVALDHCTNGVQTSRAIAILVAICGNFDVPGGSTYSLPLRQASFRIKGRVSTEEAIGADYPLFNQLSRETTSTPVPDAILTGKPYPVKALIIQGANPMLTWPNTNKVRKAFEQLELLVVIDMFMTETAKQAHIILPAASFLERTTLKDYAPERLALITLANKAIEPVGNSLPDWKVWIELAKKMGYEEYFPWQTDDELYSTLLEPTGITLEQLKQEPRGIFHHPREERRYLKEGFNTPSRKVEIYSKTMEQHGYDPLPTFREPGESPLSQPELAKEYPLILITGTRINVYSHSQLHNVPEMRQHQPEPLIEINTTTAKNLSIIDSDMVTLEAPRGSIRLKARLTPDINPRVVSIQHGWDEANANILTDDAKLDPVSGYPGFKAVLCRVTKK